MVSAMLVAGIFAPNQALAQTHIRQEGRRAYRQTDRR